MTTRHQAALHLPPVVADALVVFLAIVLGVIVRTSVNKALDGPAPGSAQLLEAPSPVRSHLQAWSPTVCALVAAGVLAWAAKEARGIMARAEEVDDGSREAEEEGVEDQAAGQEGEEAPVPLWDPLEFSTDGSVEPGKRWRSLEIKHGHLTLLANVGLVGAGHCSIPPQPTDIGSNCSTESAEFLPEFTDESEAHSDLENSTLPDCENSTLPDCEDGADDDSLAPEEDNRQELRPQPAAFGPSSDEACAAGPAEQEEEAEEEEEEGEEAEEEKEEPRGEEAERGEEHEEQRWNPRFDLLPGFRPDAVEASEAGDEDPYYFIPRGSLWSDMTEDELPSSAAQQQTLLQPADREARPLQSLQKGGLSEVEPPMPLEEPVGGSSASGCSRHLGVAAAPASATDGGTAQGEASPEEGRRDSSEEAQLEALQPEAPQQRSSPSCPKAAPRRPRKNPNDKDIPMQEILHTLENVEQDRVLIVRKMKKLGFHSAGVLRLHFEQFGRVDNIYVSHSHLQSRTRPASLGFVVMDSKESAQSALAVGSEQVVSEITIYVGAFEQLDRKERL